jgi:hypothetical protein
MNKTPKELFYEATTPVYEIAKGVEEFPAKPCFLLRETDKGCVKVTFNPPPLGRDYDFIPEEEFQEAISGDRANLQCLQEARRCGREHGTNHAGWDWQYIGGGRTNTPSDLAASRLQESMRDGEMIVPGPSISDDELFEEVTGRYEQEREGIEDVIPFADIRHAYNLEFVQGYEDEMSRICSVHTSEEESVIKL